jgi:hypothetical protein
VSTTLRRPAAHFVLAALTVIVICAAVLRTARAAGSPEIAAWGVTFDLTITIPGLYWFFLVRPRRVHAITIVPLFLLCLAVASRVVPRGQQEFLRDLKLLVIPLELLLVWAVVTKRALPPLVARVVRSEMSIFWHAFFAWRKTPNHVDGRAVTFHERSGWGTIVAAFILVIAAEGVAMHLFLARWNTTAAWAWTFLDVWGAIWLIGDYHALRLNRSWLTPTTLHIRVGLRWSADIGLSNIASIEEARDERQWKQKGVLKLAVLEAPRWMIALREPVIVDGIAGIRKEISAIAMLPDDDEFVSDVRRALASLPTGTHGTRP